MNKYPRFFRVSDTYVTLRFDVQKNKVIAQHYSGNEYDLKKVLIEGWELTEAEYNDSVKERIAYLNSLKNPKDAPAVS